MEKVVRLEVVRYLFTIVHIIELKNVTMHEALLYLNKYMQMANDVTLRTAWCNIRHVRSATVCPAILLFFKITLNLQLFFQ